MMRLDSFSQDFFVLFVNACYFKDIDWEDQDSISHHVKKIISFVDDIYHIKIQGFYQMTVYVHPLVGAFIELERDDFDFDFSSIDLKITIYLKKPFYLGVSDLFFLPFCDEVYFYDGKYYVNLDTISFSPSLLEMGKVIYGSDVDTLMKKGKLFHYKKR